MIRCSLPLLLALSGSHAIAAQEMLDNFDDVTRWQVQHTDDVTASLHAVDDKAGKALRLDFDFTDSKGNPINGYATARRALALDLPQNYELSFRVRGEAPGRSPSAAATMDGRERPPGRSPSAAAAMDGRERPPVNNLQFKLIDASGENVWWLNQPDFAFPQEWQQIRIKQRQLSFAWGPATDRTLRHSASVEFVVSSGRDGGKGSVYFDQLSIRELPPDAAPARPELRASSMQKGFPASAAMDGDLSTGWRSDPRQGPEQNIDVDFKRPREFGGVILQWRKGESTRNVGIALSNDGKHWHSVGGPFVRSGDDDAILLTDSESRYLRLALHGDKPSGLGLNEIQIKDPAWGASNNAFFQNLAKAAPRGGYPRGFVEQSYWTIVGVDGGGNPALISEDGVVEPHKGSYCIEPFLTVDGRTLSWADVTSTQSLLDGYLPMPGVDWKSDKLNLSVETFARGTPEAAQIVVRYRVRNTTDAALQASLQLAIRPFQVNPPAQFLNSPGGVSPIRGIGWDGRTVRINDAPQVLPLVRPGAFLAGEVAAGALPDNAEQTKSVYDVFGYASGTLVYKLQLPARGEWETEIIAPISGALAPLDLGGLSAAAWFERERAAVAGAWRSKLNQVKLTLPAQAQRIADALRTAQAHILITREGAALRPGTRSYARSWIRDGAMIADGLLRLGGIDAARAYIDWYAPHQFANGKVPCCVDHRGSDPVPENDSHGELIHAIAQLYRYSGDRAQLEKQWPHVQAAIAYMDGLRASEDGKINPAFKGLMPASISHEGYSSKPMHSYWDDFWALTGYNDAVDIAQALGKPEAIALAHSRDEFHRDLNASIVLATKARAIDFIPGSAELGDFDATSTTIALSPAGQQASLPQDLLHNTFERYWRDFVARSDGSKPWNDYTPYEWRTVGTFVRLGWRDRAQAALDFFFATGARPLGWNQWAEVVGHEPRQIRFIGDMPHGWVASDFIRSALDLFAYERDSDHAIVLAAGVPANWLEGEGVAISDLRTPYGRLGYTLKQNGKRIVLRIAAGAAPPGGFAFAWPRRDAPGATRINGHRANWQAGELHIAAAPAEIVVELGVQR